MRTHRLSVVLLATVFAAGCGLAVAQTAGQDMKNAGTATKDAAKDTGHATAKVAHKTAHGTKVAAKDTAHVTKKGYHKTVAGTKKLGDKIEDKTTDGK